MPPLLEMRGIEKSFPGVRALRGVDLSLNRGEVLALVGENGAGKSTLIKVLGGAHWPDSGEVWMEGQSADLSSPASALRAGVGVIYQEFNLVPDLTVRENLFLGREEAGRFGWVDAGRERQRARAVLGRNGCDLDPDLRCRDLTVAQQQFVEIAKALSLNARILVMDEPTAALTAQEASRLLNLIRELKRDGIAVIYVSHRLDEVYAIADRITVLRDGATVGGGPVREMARGRLIEMMVGRPLNEEFPKRSIPVGEERLRVEGLCRGRAVQEASFAVRGGEVLGIAGLVGAGRTEMVRLIFGADTAEAGIIRVNGAAVQIRTPRDAIRQRICLLTEDRKRQGLILQHTIQENFGLPNLKGFSRGVWLDPGREEAAFRGFAERLKIRHADSGQAAGELSGGNQQKVVLAKWLQGNADIVIFDEPTRGIDVGAKYEIYLLINELAKDGKAVILISSELPEILGMSDRILVMHGGRIRGEIRDVARTSQEDILKMAIAS